MGQRDSERSCLGSSCLADTGYKQTRPIRLRWAGTSRSGRALVGSCLLGNTHQQGRRRLQCHLWELGLYCLPNSNIQPRKGQTRQSCQRSGSRSQAGTACSLQDAEGLSAPHTSLLGTKRFRSGQKCNTPLMGREWGLWWPQRDSRSRMGTLHSPSLLAHPAQTSTFRWGTAVAVRKLRKPGRSSQGRNGRRGRLHHQSKNSLQDMRGSLLNLWRPCGVGRCQHHTQFLATPLPGSSVQQDRALLTAPET